MNDEMEGWTSFDEKYPDKFPCRGRNVELHVEDVITGMDESNKAFKHAAICKSLKMMSGRMSMPFTHWKYLDE